MKARNAGNTPTTPANDQRAPQPHNLALHPAKQPTHPTPLLNYPGPSPYPTATHHQPHIPTPPPHPLTVHMVQEETTYFQDRAMAASCISNSSSDIASCACVKSGRPLVLQCAALLGQEGPMRHHNLRRFTAPGKIPSSCRPAARLVATLCSLMQLAMHLVSSGWLEHKPEHRTPIKAPRPHSPLHICPNCSGLHLFLCWQRCSCTCSCWISNFDENVRIVR